MNEIADARSVIFQVQILFDSFLIMREDNTTKEEEILIWIRSFLDIKKNGRT
jgi:hypothetical protein